MVYLSLLAYGCYKQCLHQQYSKQCVRYGRENKGGGLVPAYEDMGGEEDRREGVDRREGQDRKETSKDNLPKAETSHPTATVHSKSEAKSPVNVPKLGDATKTDEVTYPVNEPKTAEGANTVIIPKTADYAVEKLPVNATMNQQELTESQSKSSLQSEPMNQPHSKVYTSTVQDNLALGAKMSTSPAKLSTSPSKLSTSPAKLSTSHAKLSTSPAKLSSPPAKLSTPPVKMSASPAKISTSLDKKEVGLQEGVRKVPEGVGEVPKGVGEVQMKLDLDSDITGNQTLPGVTRKRFSGQIKI